MKTIVLTAFLVLVFAGQPFARRSLVLLDVKKGPGVNTDQIDFMTEKLNGGFKTQNLFDLKSRVAVAALVEKLGGCKTEDCQLNAVKELKINLAVTVQIHKQRADYLAAIYVYDTDFGEQVFEYQEQLPGDLMLVSDQWVLQFLSQLEPFAMEPEQVTTESETPGRGEAEKATVIMDDETSGKWTKDKSPYLLIKTLVVPANQTLEIEKGVTVLVGGDYASLVVYGQVMANGTAEEPITFKSAKKEARQWDWDRVYVRGSTRSYFTHCVFMNSNFGLCVDNGNATLTECQFLKNSISCVYALQSDVQLTNVEFGGGHIVGLHVDRGSKVYVDSGSIRNVSRAVVVQAYAGLEMARTRIENNDFGIVADARARLELRDAFVSDNRVGVLSQADIPRGRLFMITGNDRNARKAEPAEMEKLFARPEKIASVRVKERELADTAGFKGGFSSLPSRGESFMARMGLLGQVSFGLSYRSVTDLNSEVHDSLAAAAPADLPHQTTYLPGLRPELQLFIQNKMGNRESNFTLNGYGNYNSPRLQTPTGEPHLENLEAYRNLQKIELINLTTTLPGQNLILGDFSQNKSELSVSSRQVRGLKYSRRIELRENRLLTAEVLGGQSSVPYPQGLKPDMLDSNTTPTRQEWLGMAQATIKAGPDLTFGAHLIGTRQVDDPLLFPGLNLDSTDLYGSDPKIKAVSGGASARLALSNRFSLYAEADAGYGDTLSHDVDSAEGRPAYSADTVIHHAMGTGNAAGLLGLDYSLSGFSGNLEYLRAQNQFFTGGNPSIKPLVGDLQKIKFTGGRTFETHLAAGRIKTVEVNAGFDWEAVGTEEIGVKADTLGADKLALIDTSEDRRRAEYERLANAAFTYRPVENKFKGSLGFKVPVNNVSVEPDFSYYYETKPMLKIDSKSTDQSIDVDGVPNEITATSYDDAEGRLQMAANVVWTPAYSTDKVSNLRFKVGYEVILISDLNAFDTDSTKWNRNDGSQNRIRGSVSSKFLKRRLGNKLDFGYKLKTKKDRDENKATYNILDKFTVDIIPRKIQLGLNGYYTSTGTDYTDREALALGNRVTVTEKQTVYGGEAETKFGLSAVFSLILKGGYENGYDDSQSGSENYETFYGGLTANYLF